MTFSHSLQNFQTKLTITATFGQIILFLFKSHHFETYFLYIIRYNSISRPVHDHTTPCESPTTPQPKMWELRPPTPRINAPERKQKTLNMKGEMKECYSYGKVG